MLRRRSANVVALLESRQWLQAEEGGWQELLRYTTEKQLKLMSTDGKASPRTSITSNPR